MEEVEEEELSRMRKLVDEDMQIPCRKKHPLMEGQQRRILQRKLEMRERNVVLVVGELVKPPPSLTPPLSQLRTTAPENQVWTSLKRSHCSRQKEPFPLFPPLAYYFWLS